MKRLLAALVRLLTIVTLSGVFRPWVEQLTQQTAAKPRKQGEERRTLPGWSRPKPEQTPKPTYWPFLLALGVMFLSWGIISNIFVLCMGLILVFVSAVGWIGDLLNEA